MNRLNLYLIIIFLSIISVFAWVVDEEPYMLYDDFEDGIEPTLWSSTVSTSVIEKYEGLNSVAFELAGDYLRSSDYTNISSTNSTVYSLWFYLSSAAAFDFEIQKADGNNIRTVSSTPENWSTNGDSGVSVDSGSCDAVGNWIQLMFLFDNINSNMSVSCYNGTSHTIIDTNIPLAFDAHRIQMTYSATTAYVDKVEMWDYNTYGYDTSTGIPVDSDINVTITAPLLDYSYGTLFLSDQSNILVNITYNSTNASCTLNGSLWNFLENTSNIATFFNNSKVNEGTHIIESICTDQTHHFINGTDTTSFFLDVTPPSINGTFDEIGVVFDSYLSYNFTLIDNVALVNYTFHDSCLNNHSSDLTGAYNQFLITNNTDTCLLNPQFVNITVCDTNNCTNRLYNWNISGALDNCSTFTQEYLNWTFYRSPGQVSNADSFLNITCTDPTYGLLNVTLSSYYYGRNSSTFCGYPSDMNLTCNGKLFYTASWTQGWLYDYSFVDSILTNDTTHLNLTVPQLFLNFSQATDIQIITKDQVIYYEQASILLAMSNLSLGKVSVVFNNGTQFFEYENDYDTYISEELKVLTQQDDYLNIRVQDTTFGILTNAITQVFEVDSSTNSTSLVNSLYSNNEKSLYLQSDSQYLIKSSLPEYEQVNAFDSVVPQETEGNDFIVSMIRNISSSNLYIKRNFGGFIPFSTLEDSYYPLELSLYSKEPVDMLLTWSVNGSVPQEYYATSKLTYSLSRLFNEGDKIHTIIIYIDGSYYTTYTIEEKDPIITYQSEFFSLLRYSRLAFGIFFTVTLLLSLLIHQNHKNYGITSALGLSILFSFLNLYMLIIAVPLGLGLIAKKINGDDL